MEIVKALLDAENPNIIVYFDEIGNSEIREYPPKTEADIALVEKLGGHYEITKATHTYNTDLGKEIQIFERFRESKMHMTEKYAIDSLMADTLETAELMKLKLTIFNHDFVKNSKNREVLVDIRQCEDPLDLIMYFAMLRKEHNARIS